MTSPNVNRAKLERRIVRVAVQWAKRGHGWLFNGDGQPSDKKLAEKLEQAIADLNETMRK